MWSQARSIQLRHSYPKAFCCPLAEILEWTNGHYKLNLRGLVKQPNTLSGCSSVGLPTLVSEAALGADVEMVQGGEETGVGLIAPRRLPNPCLDSPQRMDLHRELMFNQKIGKNVLNQKSELQKALSKHKEKQIMNQVNQHKETPELERAIAERAKRLEQAEPPVEDDGTNPTLAEVRARLRHTAPPSPAPAARAAPAASAH